MAQTIALQRGTSSVTLNGSTKYTAFTQSGGTATRVIINGVSFYSDNARTGLAMLLGVQKSGGGFFMVAMKMISNNASIGSMDFLPGNMSNISGGSAGTNAVISTQTVTAGNVGGSYQANQNPGDNTISGGNNTSQGFGNASNFEFCPAQFWIGPSDIVYFVGRTSSADTGQWSWSFTTITES
jgi:hypothetical protein